MEKQIKDNIKALFNEEVQNQVEITKAVVELINGMTKDKIISDLVGWTKVKRNGELEWVNPTTYEYHLVWKWLMIHMYSTEVSNSTIEECGKWVDYIMKWAKKQK